MHYLIDGYNLLHHVGRLQPGRGNLEAARLDLLRLLHGRFSQPADEVTVVFDARNAPPSVKDQQDYQGIAVRFTRGAEADDLIEQLIRETTRAPQLTIVSNDRRLKEAARRKRCPVMECVAFWEVLLDKPQPTNDPAPVEPERPPATRADVEHWAREFGDLDGDAEFKELFGPDFEE